MALFDQKKYRVIAKCATCENALFRRPEDSPEETDVEFIQESLRVNGWASATMCDDCTRSNSKMPESR